MSAAACPAGVDGAADREVGDVDDGLARLFDEGGDAVEVPLLPRAEVLVVAGGALRAHLVAGVGQGAGGAGRVGQASVVASTWTQ